MLVRLLNGAECISVDRTEALTNIGVRDVVEVVGCDSCPMLACPHPDLDKNSMVGWEGWCLGRQKFDTKVLNDREAHPMSKQHQNRNMNEGIQKLTFAIRKTEQ